MTKEEDMVIFLLCKAWDKFLKLPEDHPDDITEFGHANHAAQNIILSREERHNYRSGLRLK